MQKKLSVADEIKLKKLKKDSNLTKILRFLFNNLFKNFLNFNLYIKNPFINKRLFINISKHKLYWHNGRKFYKKLVNIIDLIILDHNQNIKLLEVGSGIGFLSQIIAEYKNIYLVCIEPDSNNLKYLKKNLIKNNNKIIFDCVISEKNKKLDFYLDNVTGLHSSTLIDNEVFQRNYPKSKLNNKPILAESFSLTYFVEKYLNNKIDIIKINVDMMENKIIQNAKTILKNIKPIFIITIYTHKIERKPLLDLFKDNNYKAYNEDKRIIKNHQDLVGNIFFIPEDHFICQTQSLGFEND